MEQDPRTPLNAASDLVRSRREASVSLLQRHFALGYSAALHLMNELQASGVVTAPDASGRRAVPGKAKGAS